MGNISPISIVTTAATTIGNLILVTPQNTIGYQPQNADDSNGTYTNPSLLFHYEGENTATVESDITDHYVEDNTAIQDQIALRPVLITTQGFIGELNDIPPNKVFQVAKLVANKLTTINAYTPALSITALIAYNEAVFAYETAANLLNNAVSSYNSITGNGSSGTTVIQGDGVTENFPPQTQQQKYYQQFYSYWSTRTLFTVQTPWAIFTDMAIKSMKAVQSAETNVITDFEITFKQMRFAKALDAAGLYTHNANFAGQLQQQGAPLVQKGTNALTESPNSFSRVLTSTTDR